MKDTLPLIVYYLTLAKLAIDIKIANIKLHNNNYLVIVYCTMLKVIQYCSRINTHTHTHTQHYNAWHITQCSLSV